MNNPTQVCECGSDEFITKPNAYDVYKVINGVVLFMTQEYVEDVTLVYCRNCSKEQNVETLPGNLTAG